MSASVNNGVVVGDVHVLVRPTERDRSTYELLRDLAASLVLLDDLERAAWVVSVHPSTGPVLAARTFPSRRRAQRARTDLVAAAEASEDLTTFDWVASLARV